MKSPKKLTKGFADASQNERKFSASRERESASQQNHYIQKS